MAIRATTMELVTFVKAYAAVNYHKDGWDEVVEAWDDGDIILAMGTARTVNGAVCKVAAVVKARHSYAKEIRATAF